MPRERPRFGAGWSRRVAVSWGAPFQVTGVGVEREMVHPGLLERTI